MSKKTPSTENRLLCGVPKSDIDFKSIRNSTNKVSDAYIYFVVLFNKKTKKEIDEKCLFCKVCFKNWKPNCVPKVQKYFRTSSTGNMYSHLAEKHEIHVNEVDEKVKITSFFTSDEKKTEVNPEYFFLLWVALDNLPLSKVDGRGFRLLMANVASSVKIPTRGVLSRRCLSEVFNVFKKHVCELIAAEVQSYTLALDIWTDDFQKIPYLAFVLHYAHDFKHREILLEIAPFLESHTGVAISLQIKRIVKEYGLNLSRLRIVSDSASNNILATEILKCKFQPCIAHRINTVVTTAMDNNVAALGALKKCRQIYKFFLFKKNELDDAAEIEANEVIETVSEHFDILSSNEEENSGPEVAAAAPKSKRIRIDVQTRWNSTYLMLNSMIELESRITHVLFKLQKRSLAFSDEELAMMKHLMTILEPFYNTTLTASKSTTGRTAIKLVFEILDLFNHLEKMTRDEKNHQIVLFLVSLKTNLIQKVDISEELLVAVLLDPFLKDASNFKDYLSKHHIDAFGLLKRFVQEFDLIGESPVRISTSTQKPTEDWRTKFRRVEPTSEDFSQTITRYLESDFSPNTLAVEYWKSNPGCLSKLSEIIHTMPFASVSVERTFSCAGNVLNRNRNSLSPSKVKMLMFINRNYDLCKETISTLSNF